MISLDEPPSSDTGRTLHAFVNAEHIAFPPVPPEITRQESSLEARSCSGSLMETGACSEALLGTQMSNFVTVAGRSKTEDPGLSCWATDSRWSMAKFETGGRAGK